MHFDPIYMARVPSTAVMVFLVGLIVLLRRRSPRLDIGVWMLATGFILLSQLGWFFNGLGNPLRMHLAHTAIVLGQMLAGASLLLYGKGPDRRWMVGNAISLVAFVSLYGFYVAKPSPYLAVGAVGLIAVALSAWRRGIGLGMTLAGMLPLAPAMVFAELGWYRMTCYWVLAAVYGLAFLHLRRVLAAGTVGRVPMLTSTGLWALVYATHAAVLPLEFWRGFADQVWDLLKYLLVVGMLLVMLEDQLTENQHMALHDPLTGLPNRRSLLDWLERAIERARRSGGRVTVLLVDLNGFKRVNDTYGHLAGDHLLATVARRMRAVIEPGDLLVRLGGDEFVLASTAGWNVERMEETLRRAIEEPVEMDGSRFSVGGSFGVAAFPEDVADGDAVRSELLRVADERMYVSKAKG